MVFWSEPGRSSEAEVDPARVHGLESPELLGDHERRVVREHDPARPEADLVRVCAATWAISTLVADEAIVAMLWCSAYQTRRYPGLLGPPGDGHARGEAVAGSLALADRGQVEDRDGGMFKGCSCTVASRSAVQST